MIDKTAHGHRLASLSGVEPWGTCRTALCVHALDGVENLNNVHTLLPSPMIAEEVPGTPADVKLSGGGAEANPSGEEVWA